MFIQCSCFPVKAWPGFGTETLEDTLVPFLSLEVKVAPWLPGCGALFWESFQMFWTVPSKDLTGMGIAGSPMAQDLDSEACEIQHAEREKRRVNSV